MRFNTLIAFFVFFIILSMIWSVIPHNENIYDDISSDKKNKIKIIEKLALKVPSLNLKLAHIYKELYYEKKKILLYDISFLFLQKYIKKFSEDKEALRELADYYTYKKEFIKSKKVYLELLRSNDFKGDELHKIYLNNILWSNTFNIEYENILNILKNTEDISIIKKIISFSEYNEILNMNAYRALLKFTKDYDEKIVCLKKLLYYADFDYINENIDVFLQKEQKIAYALIAYNNYDYKDFLNISPKESSDFDLKEKYFYSFYYTDNFSQAISYLDINPELLFNSDINEKAIWASKLLKNKSYINYLIHLFENHKDLRKFYIYLIYSEFIKNNKYNAAYYYMSRYITENDDKENIYNYLMLSKGQGIKKEEIIDLFKNLDSLQKKQIYLNIPFLQNIFLPEDILDDNNIIADIYIRQNNNEKAYKYAMLSQNNELKAAFLINSKRYAEALNFIDLIEDKEQKDILLLNVYYELKKENEFINLLLKIKPKEMYYYVYAINIIDKPSYEYKTIIDLIKTKFNNNSSNILLLAEEKKYNYIIDNYLDKDIPLDVIYLFADIIYNHAPEKIQLFLNKNGDIIDKNTKYSMLIKYYIKTKQIKNLFNLVKNSDPDDSWYDILSILLKNDAYFAQLFTKNIYRKNNNKEFLELYYNNLRYENNKNYTAYYRRENENFYTAGIFLEEMLNSLNIEFDNIKIKDSSILKNFTEDLIKVDFLITNDLYISFYGKDKLKAGLNYSYDINNFFNIDLSLNVLDQEIRNKILNKKINSLSLNYSRSYNNKFLSVNFKTENRPDFGNRFDLSAYFEKKLNNTENLYTGFSRSFFNADIKANEYKELFPTGIPDINYLNSIYREDDGNIFLGYRNIKKDISGHLEFDINYSYNFFSNNKGFNVLLYYMDFNRFFYSISSNIDNSERVYNLNIGRKY